jgi:Peptidase_C39 like family
VGIKVRLKRLLSILFFYAFFTAPAVLEAQWTWLYQTHLADNKNEVSVSKNELLWSKTSLPKFSQLIFSWNALRPHKGYYSFWIRVRDSATKKWYSWHQMAHWGTSSDGKNVQRSFLSITRVGTKYVHVRLELPRGSYADAFNVKIKAHDRAELSGIKNSTVNTCNLSTFVTESRDRKLKSLSSTYIEGVPRRSQRVLKHPKFKALCSPTAATMLMSYLLKENLDPHCIAQGVYDHGLAVYGSWPFNIAHAFEVCKNKLFFHVERLASFKALHAYLCQGIPVVVSVRGLLKGAPVPYMSGHLLVVVGYSNRFGKVLCQDPAFSNNEATAVAYDLKDFLVSWERSHRLTYVARYVL